MKKQEIIYSEPVSEIMGSTPPGVLRWGTTAILAVFIFFILLAWFLKYPEVVPSPVEITTENPPVTLPSRINGKIDTLFVKANDSVSEGMICAVMETTAQYDQIEILRNYIDKAVSPLRSDPGLIPDLDKLGELQDSYTAFRKNIESLNNFVQTDYYGGKIKSAMAELSELDNYIRELRRAESLFNEKLSTGRSLYNRDSAVFSDRSIAEAELERSKLELTDNKIDFQNIRLQIAKENVTKTQKEREIIELTAIKSKETNDMNMAVDGSFRILKNDLKSWEKKYLLTSSINGIVTFTKYWTENQVVKVDEPVITIVPTDPGNYIGRISLKMQKSGKVIPGCKVYIKLNSYPHLQYGMIQGVVKRKSLVTADNNYIVDIELPDELITLYGDTLEFVQNMQGTAEIITDDRRLLERIFSPFRSLISRNI